MPNSEHFMYFAYGSNLLKRRIHINNPSAEFIGIGKLHDHQLDFMKWSQHWRGTSATIVPIEKAYVWGAVWRLHKRDMPALDKQEGVDTNWYFPKTVNILKEDGSVVECRTYQQTINPEVSSEIPQERRPSITYLNCIINGAIECRLPDEYIKKLKQIPHNGQEASPEMLEKLKNMQKLDTFMYFAYGGNLLKRRIHMNNPSAEFVSIARLDNYRMGFIKYSKFWGGPTATMIPTANAHIWGAIWRIANQDMLALDIQKGVDVKKYYPTDVEVLTPYMGTFKCRAYQQRVNPLPRGDNDPIPIEMVPSKTYKEIIVLGAIERGLPEYYINDLKRLRHNGEEGCLRLTELCIRYGKEAPCECRVPGRIPRVPLKLNVKLIKPKIKNVKSKTTSAKQK